MQGLVQETGWSMDKVIVRTDDRARLLSAMLAVTTWPEGEQARKPHGTHAHARATRRYLSANNKHPAVLVLQALLDKGAALDSIYAYVLQLNWPGLSGREPPSWAPPTWARHLLNFYQTTRLEAWWEDEAEVWEDALTETEKMFRSADLKAFLYPFVGDIPETLIFMPNVCYPSDQEIGVHVRNELWCIAPPRIAWGDNPPWPFDEDPAHLFRAALSQFGRLAMIKYLNQHAQEVQAIAQKPLPVDGPFAQAHPRWEEQFLALYVTGLVALYLDSAVSKQEADAYILMEKKASGVKVLPGVVSVLRRYLSGHESGQYSGFIDYLPHFGNHLRVAKTITAL